MLTWGYERGPIEREGHCRGNPFRAAIGAMLGRPALAIEKQPLPIG